VVYAILAGAVVLLAAVFAAYVAGRNSMAKERDDALAKIAERDAVLASSGALFADDKRRLEAVIDFTKHELNKAEVALAKFATPEAVRSGLDDLFSDGVPAEAHSNPENPTTVGVSHLTATDPQTGSKPGA